MEWVARGGGGVSIPGTILRDVYVVLRDVGFWCLVDFVTLKFFSNVDSVTL